MKRLQQSCDNRPFYLLGNVMEITYRRMSNGNKDIVVAFIDTEGLDLGIETTYLELDTEDDEVAPYVDPEDDSEETEVPSPIIVDVDDGPYNLNQLYFLVGTYQKLTENPEGAWELLLRGANRFLDTLSPDELRQFCLFFIYARQTITRELIGGSAITDVATHLGNELYDLALAINLPAKLLHYVQYESGIPIPDLSTAGTNASRDSEDMTFRVPEYYVLLAISVLCKILAPIWGDMIERTRDDVDNMLKEIQCINLIEPILTIGVFSIIREKLYNYVSTIVNTEMKNSYATASFAATIGGVSRTQFHHIVFCNLIVKRFVTIDLYMLDGDKSSNVMIWVATCSRQSYTSTQQALNKRCRIMPRTDISENASYGEEERSVSVLEHSSRITDVTADTPQLIRFGARMAVQRLRKEYEVSEFEFLQVMNYYQQNPIQVTSFNKILVGVFVGNHIGGAQGIKYLDLPLYMELVTITQIYIAKQYAAPDVVHLLTANTPIEDRPVLELSSINSMIDNTSKKTLEYRGCEESFPYTLNSVGIGTALKTLQDYIIKHHHYANTSPFISGIMDNATLPPGTLIYYEPEVMQQCCSVILDNINPHEVRMGRQLPGD